MQEWYVPVAVGLLALVALGLAVALVRARSRTERALEESRTETARLRTQLDELERRLARPEPRAAETEPDVQFVITNLGEGDPEPEAQAPVPDIGAALFADLVLRETVVKAASLAHGVRRALAPETRNRIRFEMKREVRRSRKQRKADTREARREWAARQRAELGEEGSAA